LQNVINYRLLYDFEVMAGEVELTDTEIDELVAAGEFWSVIITYQLFVVSASCLVVST